MIEYVAPSPVIESTAPPSAATHFSLSLDTTGFVNPQFSIPAVEASASQVVGSFPSRVERVQQNTVEPIVPVPVPQIQEQIEEGVQVIIEEQIVDFLFFRLRK